MFGKAIVKLLKARKKGRENRLLNTAAVPSNLPTLLRFILIVIVTITIAVLFIRLSQCLPQFKSKRKKRVHGFNVRTMVIFGSGELRTFFGDTVAYANISFMQVVIQQK